MKKKKKKTYLQNHFHKLSLFNYRARAHQGPVGLTVSLGVGVKVDVVDGGDGNGGVGVMLGEGTITNVCDALGAKVIEAVRVRVPVALVLGTVVEDNEFDGVRVLESELVGVIGGVIVGV